jgi:hypothetical protein
MNRPTLGPELRRVLLLGAAYWIACVSYEMDLASPTPEAPIGKAVRVTAVTHIFALKYSCRRVDHSSSDTGDSNCNTCDFALRTAVK